MNDHRVFRYERGERLVTFAIWVCFAVLSGFAAVSLSGAAWLWLFTVACLGVPVYLAVTYPIRLEITDDAVTAKWFAGRSQTWPLTQLRVRDPFRYRWQIALGSGVEVQNAEGKRAFWIWPSISDFQHLFDILAPGIRVELAKKSEKSWWSRNLL